MAEDDQQAYVQRVDRILQRCDRSVVHHVTGVADREQVAESGVEHDLRWYSRIRAGQHGRIRCLPVNQRFACLRILPRMLGLAFGEPAVARQHAAPGRVRRRFPDVLHLHIALPFGCSRSRGTPRMRQRCIEMIPPAAADAHQADDVVSVSIGGMAGSSADAMRTAPVPAGIGGRSGLYCRGRSNPTRTGCCTAWRRRRPRPAARRACPAR